jgi:hypothetical protein
MSTHHLRHQQKLVNHVRRTAPVGVDQAAFDPQVRAVIAPPRPAEDLALNRLQPRVDRRLDAAAGQDPGQRGAGIRSVKYGRFWSGKAP